MPLTERKRIRPTTAALSVAAVVVVLLGVFTAIAATVVHERRPLDPLVVRSFAAQAPHVAGRGADSRSLGCRKTRVDFYACAVDVRTRRSPERVVLTYSLLLSEGGCWIGEVAGPAWALQRFPVLRGCVEGAVTD